MSVRLLRKMEGMHGDHRPTDKQVSFPMPSITFKPVLAVIFVLNLKVISLKL